MLPKLRKWKCERDSTGEKFLVAGFENGGHNVPETEGSLRLTNCKEMGTSVLKPQGTWTGVEAVSSGHSPERNQVWLTPWF